MFRNAGIRVLTLLVVAFACLPTVRAEPNFKLRPDVVYGHKLGLAMTMDVFTPTENANGAGVLFMVSGGWYSSWQPPKNWLPFFQPLLDKGYAVFAVRHGSSPRFSIPEAVSDVRRSVRYVRLNAKDFGISPDRLGVFGMSAGGHLSLMLGTASDKGDPKSNDPVAKTGDRVAAVVAFVAPTDLRIMVPEAKDRLPAYKNFPALELDMKAAAENSPLLHVSADDPPTLLIAGDKDKLVPIKHSEQIHKAFEEKKVKSELMVIKGAGHGFDPPDVKRSLERLVKWFDEHLAEAKPTKKEETSSE